MIWIENKNKAGWTQFQILMQTIISGQTANKIPKTNFLKHDKYFYIHSFISKIWRILQANDYKY